MSIFLLFQGGLIRKWTTDVMRKARQGVLKRKKDPLTEYEKENAEGVILPLTFVHMQGPLMLYLVSIILSSIAFLTENMLTACLNHHSKRGKLQINISV